MIYENYSIISLIIADKIAKSIAGKYNIILYFAIRIFNPITESFTPIIIIPNRSYVIFVERKKVTPVSKF